jgi:hypothetical protein
MFYLFNIIILDIYGLSEHIHTDILTSYINIVSAPKHTDILTIYVI